MGELPLDMGLVRRLEEEVEAEAEGEGLLVEVFLRQPRIGHPSLFVGIWALRPNTEELL